MKILKLLLLVMVGIGLLGCTPTTTTSEPEYVAYDPIFVLPSGTYEEGQYIAIRSNTYDAEIHYTTDNSEPDYDSPLYTHAMRMPDFFINQSNFCIVKARAFREDSLPSKIVTATYTINYPYNVATPVISVIEDKDASGDIVNLTCSTPDAHIRYTTDGSEPSYYSELYVNPFVIDSVNDVKARAFKSGWNASSIAPMPDEPALTRK